MWSINRQTLPDLIGQTRWNFTFHLINVSCDSRLIHEYQPWNSLLFYYFSMSFRCTGEQSIKCDSEAQSADVKTALIELNGFIMRRESIIGCR